MFLKLYIHTGNFLHLFPPRHTALLPGHKMPVLGRHAFPFLLLNRCEWVRSLPAGPRREAVCPWVCQCPRLVPLLLPQRLQVAPRWAELWGWVTRGNRRQRLFHKAPTADLAGYVAPERNTCDIEGPGAFDSRVPSFCRCVCQSQTWLPLPFRPLKLIMVASGMNDLTLSQQKGSLGHEAFVGD